MGFVARGYWLFKLCGCRFTQVFSVVDIFFCVRVYDNIYFLNYECFFRFSMQNFLNSRSEVRNYSREYVTLSERLGRELWVYICMNVFRCTGRGCTLSWYCCVIPKGVYSRPPEALSGVTDFVTNTAPAWVRIDRGNPLKIKWLRVTTRLS
jgi:hypothetical protein